MPDIVFVEWDDAFCGTKAWYGKEEVDIVGKCKVLVAQVGYLLRATKAYIVLAGGCIKADGEYRYNNIHRIPITWIGMYKKVGTFDNGDKDAAAFKDADLIIKKWRKSLA